MISPERVNQYLSQFGLIVYNENNRDIQLIRSINLNWSQHMALAAGTRIVLLLWLVSPSIVKLRER